MFSREKFKKLKSNFSLLVIFAIPLIWYLLFMYMPMYGVQIAFRRFNPGLGITKSDWVGLFYFKQFFDSFYFSDLIRNTVLLSVQTMLIGFPMPIILALLINEVGNVRFKKAIQNITYMPHFLSVVVVVSMLSLFSNTEYGLFNMIRSWFGLSPQDYMTKAEFFRPLYVLSNVWQHMGFNAVIYIAALSTIDQTLYEAAEVDGASRLQKIRHISIPGIMSTILVLLILRIGSTMDVGFEKALLMQNPINTDTSEIISTFIYKNGIQKGQFSYSAAVGLFNSLINFMLLLSTNLFSRKISGSSLW